MDGIKLRILKDRIFTFFVYLLTLLSVIPLFAILFSLFKKGIGVININFFLTLPKPPPEAGGILNALVGTFLLVVIASVISIPIGIIAGLFLVEAKTRFANMLRVLVNVLQGLPSIVIGIVAYIWVVKPMGGFSAFSGGVALGMMMLPMVIKSTEETVKLIPYSLREASYALGADYFTTIVKVVLPAAIAGILNGILLGIARIAGETAPLLFTAFGNPYLNFNPAKPVDSLPLLIFNYAMSPYESWQNAAWGASFVLIMFVLALNIAVKIGGKKWSVRL